MIRVLIQKLKKRKRERRKNAYTKNKEKEKEREELYQGCVSEWSSLSLQALRGRNEQWAKKDSYGSWPWSVSHGGNLLYILTNKLTNTLVPAAGWGSVPKITRK